MKPIRNPDVETKMLPDGHVVIFSNNSDWAHTITPLAAIAWEYCDGEHSVEEIVDCIKELAQSPANNENLRPEITDLIKEFTESGLVSI